MPTATPILAVGPATDPDGDTVEYFFRLTEAADAETGPKVEADWWSASTSWQVPAGYLEDGVTCSWHAWTRDASGWVVPPWAASFTLALNLGRSGLAPIDEVGHVLRHTAAMALLQAAGCSAPAPTPTRPVTAGSSSPAASRPTGKSRACPPLTHRRCPAPRIEQRRRLPRRLEVLRRPSPLRARDVPEHVADRGFGVEL